MIGNDIVDLRAARTESNWKRKGFLQKVFDSEECQEIWNSKDRESTVWLLWSMKEAAYKANQRQHNLPRKLNWQDQHTFLYKRTRKAAAGIVTIGESVFFTFSDVCEDYLHTIAVSEPERPFEQKIFTVRSSRLKAALLERFSRLFSCPKPSLSIRKDQDGKPMIFAENRMIFERFSLSHHGRFSAYSTELMNCEMPVKHY